MPTLVQWSGASQGRADSRPIRSGDLEPRAAGGTAWAAPPPGPPPDPQCPAVCTNVGGVLRVVVGLFSFILRKRLHILYVVSKFSFSTNSFLLYFGKASPQSIVRKNKKP